MKKLCKAVSVLAMAAMMALGGCGGGSGDSGEIPTDKEGNSVVKIMFHVDAKSAEGQAYKKRIELVIAVFPPPGDKEVKIYLAPGAYRFFSHSRPLTCVIKKNGRTRILPP